MGKEKGWHPPNLEKKFLLTRRQHLGLVLFSAVDFTLNTDITLPFPLFGGLLFTPITQRSRAFPLFTCLVAVIKKVLLPGSAFPFFFSSSSFTSRIETSTFPCASPLSNIDTRISFDTSWNLNIFKDIISARRRNGSLANPLRKHILPTVTMAVFTIKALASALAVFSAFTTGAVADELPELPEAALSAQTTTYQPVTQQHGVATADGNVVYSLSVCTIVQQTECSLVLSTDTLIPPPIATDDFSVPAEGEPTTVNGMGETSPGEGYPEVSETGPHASVPTGSKPDYSALPPPESAPSQPGVPAPSPSAGEPVPTVPSGAPGEPIPIPSVIGTDGEPENPTALTTDYDGPLVTAKGSASGSASGSDSVTDTDFPTVTLPVSSDGPSATGEDGDNTPTGTPTVTASGAVVMVPAVRAVVLGVVAMLVAAAF